ncbi:MAG: hypothetical protein AAGI51_15160 [Pseudomonadota bacterium]
MTITLDDLARMAKTDAKALRAASPHKGRGRAAEASESAAPIAADPSLRAPHPPGRKAAEPTPPDLPGWE